MSKDKRFLDLREVAARLNLGVSTVRRWASTGRLPVVKLGRRVRVDEEELDRFIDARRRPEHADDTVNPV